MSILMLIIITITIAYIHTRSMVTYDAKLLRHLASGGKLSHCQSYLIFFFLDSAVLNFNLFLQFGREKQLQLVLTVINLSHIVKY